MTGGGDGQVQERERGVEEVGLPAREGAGGTEGWHGGFWPGTLEVISACERPEVLRPRFSFFGGGKKWYV